MTPHHPPTVITHSHILAAGQTSGGTPGLLILLALLAAAGYALACWIWPFRACTRCKGAGKFLSPSGRAWRYCRKCSGRGAQLRIGRRIWTWLKTTKDGDR